MVEKSQSPVNLIYLLFDAIKRLFADEAVPLAGNIAFRSVFSIFPFLIFVTALAGFFGSEDVAQKAITFLIAIVPEQLMRPLAGEIRSILTVPRTDLLSLAAALTIWSAMAGVDSVRVGLNRAYDLKEHRRTLWLYFIDILFVIGSALVLLIVSFLIVFFPVVLQILETYIPAIRESVTTIDQFRYPVAISLLVMGLLVAHRTLPAKTITIKKSMPGVVLTVIVWIALAAVFSVYLVRFNSFASTYASLSGLFAAMFFIYLSALALIFGGEFNRVLELREDASGAK